MAILSEKTWKRHSNPLSEWSRILAYPLVYLPFGYRSWKQGAAVAAWFAVNPMLFPEPKSDESWATRGGLGEELWTSEGPRDLSTLLTSTSGAFGLGGLLSAYERRFWPMLFCASTSLLLKLWYIDRMTAYYEKHRNRAS